VKTRLPLVVGGLFGLYGVLEYYIPAWQVGWFTEEFRSWAVIMAAFAYVLGAVNIIQVTVPKIRRREPDWGYKVVLLTSAALMLVVGLPWHKLGAAPAKASVAIAAAPDGATGIRVDAPADVSVQIGGALLPAATGPRPVTPVAPGEVEVRLSRRVAGYEPQVVTVTVAAGQLATVHGDPPMLWGKDGRVFVWLYDHVFAPCNATMFALLAFFVASAAFRAFRARNVEAALLLGTAILMMLGRAPIGRALSDSLPDVAQWLLDVPNNGGRRAIMMGAAIGAIATGLRVILGLERSHLGGD